MAYNEVTSKNSPNFTAGRGGKKISGITIHWWGDPKNNPTITGVVNHLCNPASQVSAHLVISGTGRKVYQLVNDKDTAWHAGDWNANLTTIGLELDPRCRASDYDVAAEVIADLWKFYGKLPLYPHKKWVATSCPGNYDLKKLEKLANEKLNPPKPTPAPKPKPTPAPTPAPTPKPAGGVTKEQADAIIAENKKTNSLLQWIVDLLKVIFNRG